MLAPDDVEADLDTILKDRLVAAEDEANEDEEEPEDRSEAADRLQPKRADEQLCPSCFLLVRQTAPRSVRSVTTSARCSGVDVGDQRQYVERLLDVALYAPVGLALTLRDRLPGQLREGRQALANRVQLARFVGELAVRYGRAEIEREVARAS